MVYSINEKLPSAPEVTEAYAALFCDTNLSKNQETASQPYMSSNTKVSSSERILSALKILAMFLLCFLLLFIILLIGKLLNHHQHSDPTDISDKVFLSFRIEKYSFNSYENKRLIEKNFVFDTQGLNYNKSLEYFVEKAVPVFDSTFKRFFQHNLIDQRYSSNVFDEEYMEYIHTDSSIIVRNGAKIELFCFLLEDFKTK
uniref:SEA domain-containing protein n=1 Tax=Ditylenchus dipsaci TaxID=166011 RepID=A0A915CMN4_9BILA